MIEYSINRLANSRRAVILAFLSTAILFIFVWEGVEAMTSADAKNTMVRIFLLCFVLAGTVSFAIYFWLQSVYAKMIAATEFAAVAHHTAEEVVRQSYEEKFSTLLAEIEELSENLQWEKNRYTQMINKHETVYKGSVNIPFDYSTERNRIIFIQQKGANGQTVYEYAYYEVLNGVLIIGKANFKRKLYSTEDKRDGLNRMVGVEDNYTCDMVTVYRIMEIKIKDIPEPYKTAIQLGALKTETVLSLSKEWNHKKTDKRDFPKGEGEDSGNTITLLL